MYLGEIAKRGLDWFDLARDMDQYRVLVISIKFREHLE
jgi:hypothetical protein